jgi:hypothetical protein
MTPEPPSPPRGNQEILRRAPPLRDFAGLRMNIEDDIGERFRSLSFPIVPYFAAVFTVGCTVL